MGLEVLRSHLHFLFCLFARVSMKMWSTGLPVPASRLCHPLPLELKTKISPPPPLKLPLVAVFYHNRKVTNALAVVHSALKSLNL